MTASTRLPQNTARMCGPYKPSIRYGDLELMQPPFSWNSGGRFGSPELVKQVLQQQLQDGEIVTSERASNRTLELTLTIRTADLGAAALAEAALVAESIKPRNTLTFDPGDGSAPVTVFDTFPADLVHERDDAEESFGVRTFSLEIPALPYARSRDLVTIDVPAPPAVYVEEVIDDGTSTTGWSLDGTPSAANYSLTTDGDAVVATLLAPTPTPMWVYLQRSGLSVDVTALPYLRVVTNNISSGGTGGYIEIFINGSGTPATVVAADGITTYVDISAITTLTSVRVKFTIPTAIGYVTGSFKVYDLIAANSTTAGTTGRENARQIEVAGSARSQASLRLADPADALGSVLIYTTTDLAATQPPLRPWLTSGPAPTTDGTLVSGESSDLGTQHVFDLPAPGTAAGGYLLIARVKHASAGDRIIDWEAFSRMGATNDAGQSGSTTVTLVAGVWTTVTMSLMNLPTSEVGPDGLIRITLDGPAGLLLDEAWLFNLDTGRLTWVECGSDAPTGGGSSNRLWLDTASITDPKPSIWRGTDPNRADVIHAGADTFSWGAHEFVPPAINVFTVTTASTAAELSMQHYPRWHSHAAL